MIPPTVAAALTALYAAPTEPAIETTRDPRQSRVWRVETARGPIYAKQHATDGKYRRERDALRRLHGLPWAPALHGWHDDMRLLVIAPCPGHAITDDSHVISDTMQPWHLAGQTLAALHRVPCPADDMPLSDAIPRRLAGWRARARGVLPAGTLDRLAARVGDGAAFTGARRVFCHRDFAPRNWRFEPGPPPIVRAFDFEHAGPDAAEVDLLRLYDGPFIDHPAREAAFLAGYGAAPDPARLDVLLALHALATVTWGRLHDDAAFVARGERLIGRLCDGIERPSGIR